MYSEIRKTEIVTWEDKHKKRVYLHNLSVLIHNTKLRLGCKHTWDDDDCTCYKQAIEHYIKYGIEVNDVDIEKEQR